LIACPHCQRSVEITEQHYGTLFTCPHCNAVYFIDWGGQPELAVAEEASASENEEVNSDDFASSVSAPAPAPEAENNFTPEYNPNDYSAPVDTYQLEATPAGEDSSVGMDSYAEASPQDAYTQAEPTDPEPEAYDFGQTLDQMTEPPKPSIADTSDFSDVTQFANADTAVGPLAYTVTIEGIDSSQLVNQIKEAMTDSRFAWDVNSLIHQIGGGRLVLEGLNPAKAATLVQRIKYLPLKITWRQDVLSS
jgi:endogenous inhibitor of DNA gyrase (YacG/DUF329 family)